MLFKNLVFYHLPTEWAWSATELEARLAQRPLQPCGPFDLTTRGWIPVSTGGRLLHSVNRHHMLALGINQKLLPGSVVRQVAEERAGTLAEEQGFAVGRKQMRELRHRVADELRARALTRRVMTRAWIDSDGGWFVVDAAGAPRAEILIETLSDTLGSFAPVPLETTQSPHTLMAGWLIQGEAPMRFSIDDDLELQTADKSKAVIRYNAPPTRRKRNPRTFGRIQVSNPIGIDMERSRIVRADRQIANQATGVSRNGQGRRERR